MLSMRLKILLNRIAQKIVMSMRMKEILIFLFTLNTKLTYTSTKSINTHQSKFQPAIF